MTNSGNNSRIPNSPKKISLWELVRYNYINEDQINSNGKVDEDIYQNALRNFISDFGQNNSRLINRNRPSTAPPRPNRVIRNDVINPNKEEKNINKNPSSSHINNIRLMKDAINDNRKIQEKEKCCMCLTNNPSHIFLPCFHLCSCLDCANKVDRCPKCRAPIKEKKRVWF